ncbi:hypothetical protein ACVIHB_008089 [Bradyrhizobium liaoningense]
MGERGQHARSHQQFVIRGQRASRIAQREDRHQREQYCFPRHPPRRQSQHRRADEHTECIARYQQAGDRHGNMHVGGDLEQEAHDDEFGGADAEGTGGEREDGGRHAWLRWMRRSPADSGIAAKPLDCQQSNHL